MKKKTIKTNENQKKTCFFFMVFQLRMKKPVFSFFLKKKKKTTNPASKIIIIIPMSCDKNRLMHLYIHEFSRYPKLCAFKVEFVQLSGFLVK